MIIYLNAKTHHYLPFKTISGNKEKQDEGSSGKARSGIILSPEYNKYPEYDINLDTSTLIQVKYLLSSLTCS